MAMSSPDRHPIRLVVQLVLEGSPPQHQYRVVAYPAPQGVKLRPSTFSSRELLLQQIRTALPDFDPKLLASGDQPQVLFAGDMQLTIAQLSLLGLQ
jgi:hypothetical protein